MASRRMLAAALVAASAVAAGCGDRPTDVDASTSEHSLGFQILAEQPEGGALRVRVRLDDLDDANRVAEQLIAQKKNLNYARVTIAFLGKDDPPDGAARRTRTWPGDEPAPPPVP